MDRRKNRGKRGVTVLAASAAMGLLLSFALAAWPLPAIAQAPPARTAPAPAPTAQKERPQPPAAEPGDAEEPAGEGPAFATKAELLRLAEKFKPIPKVEFEDTDIRNIVKMISDATSVNIFVSPNVTTAIGIWATDINPIKLLEQAVQTAGATWFVKNGTVSVVSWDEYKEQFGLTKEIIKPKFLGTDELAQIVEPFLTDRGVLYAAPSGHVLVLIEAPEALKKILEMIEAVDTAGPDPEIKIIHLKHAKAETLAERIAKFFEADRTQGGAAAATRQPPARTPTAAPPAAGGSAGSAKPKAPAPAPRRESGPTAVSGATRGKVLVFAEPRTNSLIVKALRDDVAVVERLAFELDIEVVEAPTNVKVYRLENTSAESVAKVIQDLISGRKLEDFGARGHGGGAGFKPAGETPSQMGIIQYGSPPGTVIGGATGEGGGGLSSGGGAGPAGGTGTTAGPSGAVISTTAGPGGGEGQVSAAVEQPTVTVNTESNAVVVKASPEQHREVAKLIADLDRPRPQVMLEAIIVQVTTDDNFNLGVELETANVGGTNYRFLSSFGLAGIDPLTGTRSLVSGGIGTGSGFNAVVIKPESFALVIQALQEAGRSRISSAPRLLINDNATGNIQSQQEQPFTAINASTTVATTTFQGYATAGTTLKVTPHISESNFIRLQYQFTLSNFTAVAASPDIPPPRAANDISSEAVVPDGHTIIIGGLKTTQDTADKKSVPLLGDIPWAGLGFQSNTRSKREVMLFLFIRPTILRDRQFETLKYISAADLRTANLKSDSPSNEIKPMGKALPN